MNQKRPQEEESFYFDQDKTAARNDNQDQTDRDFKCKCGKRYFLQGSLFNHIKIKHDNDKENFVVPRDVKSGRPRKADSQNDEASKNTSKKNQKPEGIDKNTWNTLQNLIIGFKNEMRDDFSESEDAFEKNWTEYENLRSQLMKKLKFSARDVKEICKQTDPILQSWGLLLKPILQVELQLIFVCQYIIKFYDVSDQKREIINNHIPQTPNKQQRIGLIKEILKYDYNDGQNYQKDTSNEEAETDIPHDQSQFPYDEQKKESIHHQQNEQQLYEQQNDQNLNEQQQQHQQHEQGQPQNSMINHESNYIDGNNQQTKLNIQEMILNQISEVQDQNNDDYNHILQQQSNFNLNSFKVSSYCQINQISFHAFSLNKQQSLSLFSTLNQYGKDFLLNEDIY